MENKKFKTAFDKYLEHVYEVTLKGPAFSVTLSRNRKYVKVISVENGKRRMHSFIDVVTGDIYKAEGFKPAKHIRGNIFNKGNGIEVLRKSGVMSIY